MKSRYYLMLILLPANIAAFAQNGKDSVIVLPVKMRAPSNATKLSTIKVGNNATRTHCDYDALIAEAKNKARGLGGNIVKITKLIEPAFISKCYRIEADVYHVNELPDYPVQKTNDIIVSGADTQKYAILYIYRLPDTTAFAASYEVHLDDDSVICTVKSKSHSAVKIYKEGPVKLWAKTERREELNVSVKSGTTYYIRCGLKRGEIRMIPSMEVVDKNIGAQEYGHLLKGKKDMAVSYLNQIH